MSNFDIRPFTQADRGWVTAYMREQWGGSQMVTRGRMYDAATQPGFVALRESAPTGFLTYLVEGDECEITALASLAEGAGIGSALVAAAVGAARAAGCRSVYLITTNDNTHALRFYQRRGFHFAAVRIGGVDEARRLKPEIPLVGFDGIPIRDEIELAMML
jgi:ribosomal protein S18 acetylase RimI-like enzyme